MLQLEKVLHVEDDEDIRYIVRHYFANEWKRIDEAPSVKDCLRLIEETGNNYQLILLDLSLLNGHGVQTVEAIHSCSVGPIVIYSGAHPDVLAELQRRSKELGIYGIIEKGTFAMDRVRAIIENSVRTFREARFAQRVDTLADAFEKCRVNRRMIIYGHGA